MNLEMQLVLGVGAGLGCPAAFGFKFRVFSIPPQSSGGKAACSQSVTSQHRLFYPPFN